jgi:glycosyltransferase involved in cell wall biosynthesis
MKISVIIPAYNAANTIGETLVSVVSQTLPPDEIIVINDGSSDNTASAALAVSPSVHIVSQSNQGAAAALNAGLRLAAGDHLAFIDADDIWSPDKLETQAGVLTRHSNLDGVGGFMSVFLCPSNSAETNKGYRLPDRPEPCWLLGALLLRRHCFDRCGLFAEHLWMGYSIDWYDRARAGGLVFAMQPSVVVHRRIHPNSLSHRSLRSDRSMVEMAWLAIGRRRQMGKLNES